jgi:hypothetical protein
MERLGASMESDKTRIPFDDQRSPPASAQTYFGQFIAHELTFDDTPICRSDSPAPSDVLNHKSPFLDLDSVYGDGPFSHHSALYEDDRASLKVGDAQTEKGQTFDIPLDAEENPLLAEVRNSTNLTIRQIHAMFLKLHNLAVLELRGDGANNDLFEKARTRVRWQFQWLVRHNYLPAVCNNSIYEQVKENPRIDWGNRFAVPMEYAHAAARFGHSMVRPYYDLNQSKQKVRVEELFTIVHHPGPLTREWAIDWDLFTNEENAMAIDTTVVKALFDVPPESMNLFVRRLSGTGPFALPVRTLSRGVMMNLASGQDVQMVLDPDARLRKPSTQSNDYNPFETLDQLGLTHKTPLWYYVLLEAEVMQRGGTLGPVGTRLLAEVIEGALRADPDSFLNGRDWSPDWRPPAWKTPSGEKPIDNLYDLAVVVGLG